MKMVALSLLGLASLAALARPVLATCVPAKVRLRGQTTLAMEMNAEAQLKQANAELNATYKKLLTELDPPGKKLLVKAERDWIAYRDAECDFDGDQYRGGTLEVVEYPSCLIRLTRDHQCELERMVSDYAPH